MAATVDGDSMIGSGTGDDPWGVYRRVVLTNLLCLSSCLALVPGGAACKRKAPATLDQGGASGIALSVKLDNFGYRPDDTKVAIFSADPGSIVQVRTSAGAVVFVVPTDQEEQDQQ